jgi:hypothetical protein
MSEPTLHHGSCHCKAVQYTAKIDLTAAIRCNCSLCKKKSATMLRIPHADFTLLQGQDNLSTYVWGTKVAKHYFCKTCGIYTHHQPRTAPDKYGVNAGTLDGVEPTELTFEVLNGAELALPE